VNRLCVYFLLGTFVFSALLPRAVREDFALIPVLVQHFQEHRKSDPSITVTQFIRLHYGADYAQHRAAHAHNQLPLKCSDHHHEVPGISVFALAPIACEIPVLQHTQPPSARSAFSYLSRTCAAPDFDIWQPPKQFSGQLSG
jgi:hypothetical protein